MAEVVARQLELIPNVDRVLCQAEELLDTKLNVLEAEV